MNMNLDNLPKTIDIIRSDQYCPALSQGFPVVVLLDQSKLPDVESYLFITDWREVLDAIKTLKVRGAPAIGIAGAALMALRAAEFVFANSEQPKDEDDFDRVFVIDENDSDSEMYLIGLEYAANMTLNSRPTAISLSSAINKCTTLIKEELSTGQDIATVANKLYEITKCMIIEDINVNKTIGECGAALLPDNAAILTHCNAGSLATAYYGTALGVVYSKAQNGGVKRVYVDETRPVGQGSRLTAWELSRVGIPATLICDNMAAFVMSQGKVDAVIVGADRIAANGDVANKIGTLCVAIAAKRYDIPFYVAAPFDTIDFSVASGIDIPIETRDTTEVSNYNLNGVQVYNPAFDITPFDLITAIITECGVFNPQELRVPC